MLDLVVSNVGLIHSSADYFIPGQPPNHLSQWHPADPAGNYDFTVMERNSARGMKIGNLFHPLNKQLNNQVHGLSCSFSKYSTKQGLVLLEMVKNRKAT